MLSRFILAGFVATILVFSAGISSATHPVPNVPYDHMTCFKIFDQGQVRARVHLDALVEEFQLDPACRVRGRGRLYCSPVRKHVLRLRYPNGNALSPIEMPGDHLADDRICYRVRCPLGPRVDSLLVKDQFGRRKIGDFEERLLCTNAEIIHDASTTTTTMPPRDPCALVDCADGHFCRPVCDDPRAAECIAFSGEGDRCDGFAPPCLAEKCKPGLECVVPPGIPDLPGVCVDPVGGECRDDEDCGDGEVCEPGGPGHPGARVCVPGCHTDDQCGPGQMCRQVVCVTTPCPGFCVPAPHGDCLSDEDCKPGNVCEPLPVLAPFDFLVCVPGCRGDEDCRDGQKCSDVDCVTVPCPDQCLPDDTCGECVSDSQCPEGLRCNAAEVCKVSCDCPSCAVCGGDCLPKVE